MTIKPLAHYIELPTPATQAEVMPIIQWCKDNVGPRGIWWDIDAIPNPGLAKPNRLLYAFREEQHATLFALRWL